MAAFMIARLPSKSKSLEAVEFMQKNHFSYLLSSDFTLFDVLMASIKRDSRLATALGISEDFEQGKEEIHIISQFMDIFESFQMIKREDSDGNNPPEGRSPEEDHNVMQSIHVKAEEVDEQHVEEEDVVNSVVNQNPIDGDIEEDFPVVEAGLNEPTGDDFPDFVRSDGGNQLQFHGDEEDEEEHPVRNDEDPAAVDVSLEEGQQMGVDEDDEEELIEEEEHMEEDKEMDVDLEDSAEEDEEEDESDDSEDKTENYEEESEDKEHLKNQKEAPGNTVGRLLFTCPVKDCPSSYKTFEELKGHMKGHSDKEDYVCNVCKKKFSSKYVVMDHIRKREQKECCECGKRFTIPAHLVEHHRVHTGERPFTCGYCMKRFTQKGQLGRHERKHTRADEARELFECNQCSRKFIEKANLTRHLRTHTGAKPYSCDKCKKRFADVSNLKRHGLTHTGTKPFECGQCKKRFTQKGHLKIHELTHSGVKAFKCDDCSLRFGQKCHLTAHMRIHSGIKPYSCKKCDEKFMWPSGLQNHMKNVHK